MIVNPKGTVLVCEDDPAMVRIFQFLLHQQGIQTIFTTASGVEALQIAQREKPTLILLDLMLPDKDGLSVLREIKQIESCQFIPVIVVSGKEAQGHIRAAMDAGAIDYIIKPFEPVELGSRIKDFLDNLNTSCGDAQGNPSDGKGGSAA
ncbi:MAG: response regulator [Elusimicrobiota bacterium]|jgi:DNA-binding response OmpR family regulator